MKILFIRKSSLGDIVHAIPAFRALRDALPSDEIHWAVAPSGLQILERVAGIDRIQVMGKGFLRRIRGEGYDVAVDMQGLLKTAWIASRAAPRRYGFARGHTRERFCQLFYTDCVTPAEAHVIEKNLALVAALGARIHPGRFDFGRLLSDEDGRRMDRVLAELGTKPDFVLLNAGAGWGNKQWPPAKFGRLAARLAASHPVLVAYGPADRPLAEAVVRESNGVARLLPQTSFMEFGALAARSALVISGDTGPMHLACAVGARVLGLFAPTSPYRNGPWNKGDRWIVAATRCDFCWRRSCPWENCINRIEVDEGFAVASEMLGGPA